MAHLARMCPTLSSSNTISYSIEFNVGALGHLHGANEQATNHEGKDTMRLMTIRTSDIFKYILVRTNCIFILLVFTIINIMLPRHN